MAVSNVVEMSTTTMFTRRKRTLIKVVNGKGVVKRSERTLNAADKATRLAEETIRANKVMKGFRRDDDIPKRHIRI